MEIVKEVRRDENLAAMTMPSYLLALTDIERWELRPEGESPPDAAQRPPSIQLDDKGGILTYPAIDRLGQVPIAVIQSAGDKYVPDEESRRLFGPDTATRRLYEVNAKNHGFSGGQEELLKDLEVSLEWIRTTLPAGDGGK
jgi:hypothetical protein